MEIEIADDAARYGKLKLVRDDRGLVLELSSVAFGEEPVRRHTVAGLPR